MRQACLIAIFVVSLLRVPAASNEIPFEYGEGLLWIKATLSESAEPFNLLLDTGAGVSVINATTANRLKLKSGGQVAVRGVKTTLTGCWLKPLSAAANGIELPAKYLAVDLQQLSASCKRPVDGLLGADFFRGRVLQIDFVAQKVRILQPGIAAKAGDALRLKLRPCGICTALVVNGHKDQWLRLDTGCASALQWVTSQVRPEDCSRKTAIGLTELSIAQTETTVRIGCHEFQNVPTGLHQKPIFAGEAGLLGNGLLSRFSSITIDAKSGHLYLEARR